MTLKKIIEDKLRDSWEFRERKNKDRGIVELLTERYFNLKSVPIDTLIAVVQDYNSLDRLWRKNLEENPNFRGSDYDDKDQLEAKKMVELGYREPQNIGLVLAADGEKQAQLL